MGLVKAEKFTDQQNQLAKFAKVLGHPARIAILQYLFKINTCICKDIVNEVGLSQPTISQHLKELKNAGLIQGNIAGTSMCYCINRNNWQAMKQEVASFLNLDIDKTNCC